MSRGRSAGRYSTLVHWSHIHHRRPSCRAKQELSNPHHYTFRYFFCTLSPSAEVSTTLSMQWSKENARTHHVSCHRLWHQDSDVFTDEPVASLSEKLLRASGCHCHHTRRDTTYHYYPNLKSYDVILALVLQRNLSPRYLVVMSEENLA